jgi:hypothetical protein
LIEESIVAFVEQSARFLHPVLIGDTITPELEVSELTPKREVGLVRLTSRIRNQRGEIVLEGTHAYLIKRRPRKSEAETGGDAEGDAAAGRTSAALTDSGLSLFRARDGAGVGLGRGAESHGSQPVGHED